MNVKLNAETCNGFGNCVSAAPEVFEFAEDGSVAMKLSEIPESLREKVEDAVDLCPTASIEIVG